MKNLQTFLWFNDQAEEAASLYTSVFQNAKTISTMPGPGGKPMGVTVELAGSQFILFNGGPHYHPNPSISFYVHCETSEQVDTLWNALSQGGKTMMELNAYPWSEKYGWIEDKFGISWQIGLSKKPQSIAPTFMYTGDVQGHAEEALNFYVLLFPNSSIDHIARYEPGEQGPEGQIKHAGFYLNGQEYAAMDSHMPSPINFTPGISNFINCETQDEVDRYWDKLAEGGRHDRCGWLQDKFGVSWQVVPTALGRLLGDKDPRKAGNVMQAMMKMDKLIIKDLQDAHDKA